MAQFAKLEYFPMKGTLSFPCYGIKQHCRFECVKYHMRISVCLQFTKYGLDFMWHVVTANKFGKLPVKILHIFIPDVIFENRLIPILLYLFPEAATEGAL